MPRLCPNKCTEIEETGTGETMSTIERRTFIKSLGLGSSCLSDASTGAIRVTKKLAAVGGTSNSAPSQPMPTSSFIEYISVATNLGVEGVAK